MYFEIDQVMDNGNRVDGKVLVFSQQGRISCEELRKRLKKMNVTLGNIKKIGDLNDSSNYLNQYKDQYWV